jgi:MoxR-like ATPase
LAKAQSCKISVIIWQNLSKPDIFRLSTKTIWLAPDWWPEASDRGILFFDELSDAKTDVRAAVMPMLLTRKMHQNTLPNDILIICAMNPVGGDFGGYTFTRQFKDRLAFLKVVPTIEEWVAYSNKIGLPLYSKNMISEQPDFFLDMKRC